MLEDLFGSKIVEKICFYLTVNQKCYASELKKCLELPIFGIQNALNRLEKHGVIVSIKVGKTRVYHWNPRYPLLTEFQRFIAKAYSYLPVELKGKCYEMSVRKRSR
jgi:predicted transcriptional regulator